MISQDKFESGYAENSQMTIDEFRADFIALPCGCGDDECLGWAVVSRDPDAINHHLDFSAPAAPRIGVYGKFRKLGYGA